MLWCISRYKSSLGAWAPGAPPINDSALEAALLKDSPGSFSIVDPRALPVESTQEAAVLAESPEDRMLHSLPQSRRKARR